MSPALRVDGPATCVDIGRPGLGRLGVPAGGALDRELWTTANLLVGNPPGAAALEMLLGGVHVEAVGGDLVVAVAGACSVRVGAAAAEPWQALRLRRGERLRVARIGGARAYLAVRGGLEPPVVLGSRSDLPAGLQGPRTLPLPVGATGGGARLLRLDPPGWLHPAAPVRVVPGPQTGALTDAGRATLLGADWNVAPASDRRGIRLLGPPLALSGPPDVSSQGTVWGAVQATAGGPIILLADRGTTGGYAVCATVVSADLPRLARLRPGDPVRFEEVDVPTAVRLRRDRASLLATLPGLLRPVEA